MLAKWCEILPLFVIRWLAKRSCETVVYSYYMFSMKRLDFLYFMENHNYNYFKVLTYHREKSYYV